MALTLKQSGKTSANTTTSLVVTILSADKLELLPAHAIDFNNTTNKTNRAQMNINILKPILSPEDGFKTTDLFGIIK